MSKSIAATTACPLRRTLCAGLSLTPPGFVFNIKTYRLFTLHQTPVISLPKHLREALGASDDENVYDKDVPEEIKHEFMGGL